MKHITILGALAAAALTTTSAIAAQMTTNVFPEPPGPYKVQFESQELVDKNRPDPWNATHPRRMMISKFTPVPKHLCTKTCRIPYMSPLIAKTEDDILDAFLGPIGWPQGLLKTLEMQVCCETRKPARCEAKPPSFPKILFGTGLNTTRMVYSATAQQIASMGYEVIVMDHPYETDIVEFSNGDVIYGGNIVGDPNNVPPLVKGIMIRREDVKFLLTKLKIHKTVYLGQSYGGAAAADAVYAEPRVVSGVNLDGAMYGPAVQEGIIRPFLTFGAADHPDLDTTWPEFFKTMDEKHPDVFSKRIAPKDTSHGSYLDNSIIGDMTGLRSNKELEEKFFGKATGEHVMELFREYLSDFIEFTLHGKDQGLLAGPSERYPDVMFLRNSK